MVDSNLIHLGVYSRIVCFTMAFALCPCLCLHVAVIINLIFIRSKRVCFSSVLILIHLDKN